MRIVLLVPVVLLVLALPVRADEQEDLLGKWELTKAAAGMPAGTIWDFKKGGDLTVSIKDKSVEFKYELKGKILHLEVNGQKDTTGIIKLAKEELILKDNDGTQAEFKRPK